MTPEEVAIYTPIPEAGINEMEAYCKERCNGNEPENVLAMGVLGLISHWHKTKALMEAADKVHNWYAGSVGEFPIKELEGALAAFEPKEVKS